MPTAGKTISNILQNLIMNSDLGVRIALAIGRYIPPAPGYPLARGAAWVIARQRNWMMVRNARLNQWVVNGQCLSSAELDLAVHDTLRNQARCLYDLYRFIARPAQMLAMLEVSPEMWELIQQSRFPVPGQGKVVVGIHLSNFDLALHAIVHNGFRGMAITLAELPGGYQRQFELRKRSGMELVTASVNSFRLAIERLKAGEMVLTGADRPVENPKHWPVFFGQPAPLPVHYSYLALKAGVPVVLLAVKYDPDGRYRFLVSEPIEMKPNPNRELEATRNAELVLSAAEQFIRQAPQQWAMFLPVWPQLSETVPG